MKLHSYKDEKYTVEIDKDELLLINNAINEVCNGIHIDEWEFETRLGVSREQGRALLAEIDPLFHIKQNEEI